MKALIWTGVGACCVSCGFIMSSMAEVVGRERRREGRWWDRLSVAASEVLIRVAVYALFLSASIWLLTQLP